MLAHPLVYCNLSVLQFGQRKLMLAFWRYVVWKMKYIDDLFNILDTCSLIPNGYKFTWAKKLWFTAWLRGGGGTVARRARDLIWFRGRSCWRDLVRLTGEGHTVSIVQCTVHL